MYPSTFSTPTACSTLLACSSSSCTCATVTCPHPRGSGIRGVGTCSSSATMGGWGLLLGLPLDEMRLVGTLRMVLLLLEQHDLRWVAGGRDRWSVSLQWRGRTSCCRLCISVSHCLRARLHFLYLASSSECSSAATFCDRKEARLS